MATLSSIVHEGVQFREVMFQILIRDLKLKYHRTILGFAWSLLNPILQLTVLSVVFSHIVRIGMKDYSLYLFSGLIAWTFIQTSIQMSSSVFIEQEAFIKKVYLPKILFPFSRVCLRSIDFCLALVALTLIGFLAGFPLHATMFWLPIPVLITFVFSMGCALMISVATVFFRDIEHLVAVFLQLLYFATPILYPITMLPERYQPYLKLNPIYTQIILFQKIIFEGALPSSSQWVIAIAVALGALGMGLWLTAKAENELVYRL